MRNNTLSTKKNGTRRPSTHADNLQVSWLPVAQIRPSARNARKHSDAQVRKIADSLQQFGAINPVIVDADGEIIAGHGRYAAAQLLKLEQLPVIRAGHLTPEQVRAYRLVDNRLAELSSWDDSLLTVELEFLGQCELADVIDFAPEITGFESAEIDRLLDRKQSKPAEPPEEPIDTTRPAVSRHGDVWKLEDHLLVCGDALDETIYRQFPAEQKIQLVCTDPPYNVKIDGHVSGNGKIKHREFSMASGEMSDTEFTSFLNRALGNACGVLADGGCAYVFMDWRHDHELQAAARQIGLTQINLAVWDKGVGGMGSLYRSQHELAFIYRKGDTLHRNNVQLGKFGRNRTNVWHYPSAIMSRQGREALQDHPTPKPVAMIADILRDVTRTGDTVLDCFLGGGATLMAAERTKRRCIGIEYDPRYADACIRRWEKATGKQAKLRATGQSFSELLNEPRASVRIRKRVRHV